MWRIRSTPRGPAWDGFGISLACNNEYRTEHSFDGSIKTIVAKTFWCCYEDIAGNFLKNEPKSLSIGLSEVNKIKTISKQTRGDAAMKLRRCEMLEKYPFLPNIIGVH